MSTFSCGAAITKVMAVSPEDANFIFDKIKELEGLGVSLEKAQQAAVAEAIARLETERQAVIAAVREKLAGMESKPDGSVGYEDVPIYSKESDQAIVLAAQKRDASAAKSNSMIPYSQEEIDAAQRLSADKYQDQAAAQKPPQAPANTAQPATESVAKPREAIEHAGVKIYPITFKGEPHWSVQSEDNRTNGKVLGDTIHATLEGAKQSAEEQVRRVKSKQERNAAYEAEQAAAQAKKDANKGKSLADRKRDFDLDKPTKLPVQAGLGTGTRRESMQKAVDQDRHIASVMVEDTAAKKKDKATLELVRARGYILGASNENIPLVKQGLEAQARLKANKYEKPEYRVYSGRDDSGSFYEISKTEYDYAQELKSAPKDPRENYIKSAADSIGRLRKSDVDRVLNGLAKDNIDGVTRADLAAYIKENHPDFAQEVDEVMAEIATATKAPADLVAGDRFKDANGAEFQVWSARQGRIEAHPVVDGKPVVNRDSVQRWATTDAVHGANPEYRTDIVVQPAAVHQDPGKAPEAATAPVIAQSLAKAARKEDHTQKEMRLWLVGEIDKAVKLTEDYADYQESIKKNGQDIADSIFFGKHSSSVGLTTPQGNGTITFDVPGDGKFKIRNSLRGLMEFRAKVEAKSGTGFTDKTTKAKGLPASTGVAKGSSNQIEALSSMLEELDFEAAVDYARETGTSLDAVKISPEVRKQFEAYLKDGTEPQQFSPSRYWEYPGIDGADKDGNPIRRATLTKQIGADEYQANVTGTNATGFKYNITKDGKSVHAMLTSNSFANTLKLAEDAINAIQPEVVKPKDTGWNMAGVGFAGKRYRGRNITLDDGREVVARIYENAGQYEDAEVKVDGVSKFRKTDRYKAEKLADDFIRTLTAKAPELDLKGFTRTPTGNGSFKLTDGNMMVTVEPTSYGFQASHGSSAKSGPRLTEQQAIEWAANIRDESKKIQKQEAKPEPAKEFRNPDTLNVLRNPIEDKDWFKLKNGEEWQARQGYSGRGWSLVRAGSLHPEARNFESQSDFIRSVIEVTGQTQAAGQVVAPVATNDEPIPAVSEAQARKQMEWRNMGQKDGTKSHRLFFFEREADKGTGRAMGKGEVSLYPGASGWKVEDGDGTPYPALADAKAAAIDAAISNLQDNGYVLKPAQDSAQPAAKAEPYDATRAQELKNDIAEGELILRAKSNNGRKYSPDELAAVQRSVDSSKEKLAALGVAGEQAAAVMPLIPSIPSDLAINAHSGTSFSPEKRGRQEQESFTSALADAWDRAAKIAGTDASAIERITEVFSDIADGYRARFMATLSARGRVMSTMITGPAKFPVASNQKRMDTERKRAEEAQEYLNRGIKRLIKAARGPIDNSPESELERVRVNLIHREEVQERMKAANAALRKGDDEALRDLDFTDAQIAKLKTPDFAGRTGFPSYELTNNNAEIRRLSERLKSAEDRVAEAAAGPVETQRPGVRIEENATDDRLRLFFDGKPSEAIRDDLKSNGFKWSPNAGAWQRQLTDNARAAATRVLAAHFPQSNDAGNDGAMFSTRTSAPEKQLPLQQIERLVQSALRGVKNAPTVRVVASPEAIGLRTPVDTVPSGVTLANGDVYVFQSGIGSALDVDMVVFHELFHKGLQNVMPRSDYVAAMQDIAKIDAKVRQYASEWSDSNAGKDQLKELAKKYSGKELADQYEALATEEGLARIAEDLKAKREMGSKDMRVRRLVAWLAKMADKIGMTRLAESLRAMSYSEAEKFVIATIGRAGGRETGAGVRYSAGMTNNDVVGNQGGRYADDTTPGDFAMAGAVVDGLTVRDEIPNQSSIGSSVDDYTVLPGVREIPLSAFTQLPKLKYYSVSEEARTKRLAEQIKDSGEINPLIVVIDKEGPYVLEGGHRFDALRELGKTSFPAMVVLDNDSLNESTAPDSGGVKYSRSIGNTLTSAANNVRNVKLPAGYLVGDLINGAPGKLNWWHRSVGTMYNLAQRSAPFKRVFDSVQTFINDVSYYATEAADLAPNILPKLETWKDIAKSPLSAADTKAISAPIFEGTLIWMRDESGKPVKVATLEAAAAQLTPEQKAQRLLRGGHVSENVLKMWQGLPVDQFETIINGKYERDMLKAGVVWTDAELKSIFNLTDKQIPLYREFRKATDKSLTNLAIADMLRFGGEDVMPIREQVLASKDVSEAAETLRDYLLSLTDIDPDRADVLTDTADKMIEKGDRAKDLIDRGYAPLSRFGQYTLDVVHDGERVYFSMFESKWEAARMNRQMQAEYPNAQITQGTVSEQSYKMFAGVSPETLELFGDMLGLESQGDDASAKAFQEYLKLAKSSRSAMKRLIHRKGIAGFNEDAGRVLAGFVYSNARQTASSLHMGEMTNAANDISQTQGELKDAAVKLVDYIKNPQEEAQKLRGLLFAQYIGGSVASAMVNMTQPLTMTFPWLSQYGGVAGAAKQMAAAMKDSGKKLTGDAKLDAALHRAEEDGTVSPQEVHQLLQQSMGKGALQSGDGTTAGNVMATANNTLSRFSLGWGKLFSVAEQFNRRVTFIAAYRTAVAQGMADPDAFARKAVAETQGIYNRGNKPQWARGALGSVLFTFKQYSIAYVEMLSRMAKAGKPGSKERAQGQKAALLALGVLFLMSGAGGMPGADDLDDLISGALQALGYNFDSKARRKEFFVSLFGEGGAQFVERGVSGLPGVPIDVSGRMGLGNLVPGTGLFTKKTDHTRDVAELAGPAGDLAKRTFEAAGKLIKGDAVGSAVSVSPKAFQNLHQAYDMANMGMYRDASGKKVVDTDGYDAIAKAIGFQPTDVKRIQDASIEVQRMIGLNKMRESEIADKWALGMFEKNPAKVEDARNDLKTWNADNPSSPIRINFGQIIKRVQKMNETKTQRIAKTAPREIRETVRKELATQ